MFDHARPTPPDDVPSALEAAQAAQASAEGIADALRISELRYRRLFETARDGILLLDSDQGKITDANPFMTELLGYSHDQLLGRELWEIGLLRDKEAGQEAFRRLKREGYIRYENLPLQNRRGERREVEFVSNLYPEDGHTVIQCNIRDITERKRSEDALRKSEERLRLATEGAGVGIWELVLATNELTWTARCREIFGLPEDGGMNARSGLPWDLIHPEDAGGVRASLERVAQENTPFTHEHRIITPSGATRWVQSCGKPYYDAGGNLARVEGVLSDITERRQAEADLATAAIQHGRQAAALAVLEERTRMAQEIHDTLAQGFAGITTQLEAAEAALVKVFEPSASPAGLDAPQAQLGKVHVRIGKARDLARESLAEARHSVAGLRSSPLEAAPLAEALARLLTQKVLGTAVKSRFTSEGIPRALPTGLEHCLLRVGQEAVANAVAHAQAQEVFMTLSFETGQVRLRVRDDGHGFDPTGAGPRPAASGSSGCGSGRKRPEEGSPSLAALGRGLRLLCPCRFPRERWQTGAMKEHEPVCSEWFQHEACSKGQAKGCPFVLLKAVPPAGDEISATIHT